MKSLLTGILLFGSACAFAQAPTTPLPTYSPRQSLTPTYKSLADTAGAGTLLSLGQSVAIVRQAAPGWVVVQRGNKELFVAGRQLQLNTAPSPKPLKPEEAAPAVTPLPVDAATGLITFSEVVQVPGTSQSELYTRGKVWFVNTFTSAKAVMEVEEKDAGLLVGRGWSTIYTKTPFGMAQSKLWYTVRLSFKEGRYKYEISRFADESSPTASNPNPQPMPIEGINSNVLKPTSMLGKIQIEQRREVQTTTDRLAQSLKITLAKPATGGDW